LPTEAEWEYAARAGTDDLYAGSNAVGNVAWYGGNNNNGTTSPVAQLSPNDWGLYDMSGNVQEWNWDFVDVTYYSSSPSSDPEGAISGTHRITRGGNITGAAQFMRVSYRDYNNTTSTASQIGFRLARSIP